MPTTIRMPQLGETVTEGTVAQWLKKPGEHVEKYEPFVEISTDKVNAEVPAPVTGIIRELIVHEGQTVPTGAPIAVIDEPEAGAVAPSAPSTSSEGVPSNGVRVSPAVRRLAREHHVDLAVVAGSGAHGRVTADDILAAAGSATAAAPPPAAVPAPAPKLTPAPVNVGDAGELIPLTPARRLIAQRTVESERTAPHAWTMVEVDATNAWKWRTAAREAFERETGMKLTLLPFFMHAVAAALRAFPLMNSSFQENGILLHKHVHLGIATAIDDNLLVPVVRDADTLSIRGLALAAGALIDQARRGKLGVDQLTGGTFTVNNTGANGSVLSAPILVNGQAGIITMEAVVRRPVVRDDDAIVIRSMMNVCLSLDHRVVDGAIANGFLADVKARVEAMGPSGAL